MEEEATAVMVPFFRLDRVGNDGIAASSIEWYTDLKRMRIHYKLK